MDGNVDAAPQSEIVDASNLQNLIRDQQAEIEALRRQLERLGAMRQQQKQQRQQQQQQEQQKEQDGRAEQDRQEQQQQGEQQVHDSNGEVSSHDGNDTDGAASSLSPVRQSASCGQSLGQSPPHSPASLRLSSQSDSSDASTMMREGSVSQRSPGRYAQQQETSSRLSRGLPAVQPSPGESSRPRRSTAQASQAKTKEMVKKKQH